MINVKFTSAWCNPSGYGSSARNAICALYCSGVNVSVETVSQMPETINTNVQMAVCKNLENRDIPYKIHLIELTPDLIPQYQEKGIYTIERLYWETSKLPEEWIKPLNEIDEIWTASPQMAKMIRDSGVKTKCYCFPQTIDISKAYENIEPFGIQYKKTFTFYSIFQWILRKNPRVLLRAFWKEFEGEENVSLIIKTFRITYMPQETDLIEQDIRQWKAELYQKHYPSVYLCTTLLTDQEVFKLHKTGDVFVNPSSGEGWNRAMQEAMLMGNPVISGDNGGITDVISPSLYLGVKSNPINATTSHWIPWYTSDMIWKELDEKDLMKQMRQAFEHRNPEFAKKAQDHVCEKFSYQAVGSLMKTRLEEISKSL